MAAPGLREIWAMLASHITEGRVAIAISLCGAFFTWRQHEATKALLKRKKPTLELSSSEPATRLIPEADPLSPPRIALIDGVFQTVAHIRNMEPSCTLRVTGLRGRWTVRFAPFDKVAKNHDDGFGNSMQILTATIPKSAMTRTAAISLDISPLGTPASRFGQSGDSAEITLLSQRPLKPGDIELIWHWADGQTKR